MTYSNYTCQDYRREMMLAGLKKQLAADGLSEAEKKRIEKSIRELEEEIGLS